MINRKPTSNSAVYFVILLCVFVSGCLETDLDVTFDGGRLPVINISGEYIDEDGERMTIRKVKGNEFYFQTKDTQRIFKTRTFATSSSAEYVIAHHNTHREIICDKEGKNCARKSYKSKSVSFIGIDRDNDHLYSITPDIYCDNDDLSKKYGVKLIRDPDDTSTILMTSYNSEVGLDGYLVQCLLTSVRQSGGSAGQKVHSYSKKGKVTKGHSVAINLINDAPIELKKERQKEVKHQVVKGEKIKRTPSAYQSTDGFRNFLSMNQRLTPAEFCGQYAETAVKQTRRLQASNCMEKVEKSARWSTKVEPQNKWCRGVDKHKTRVEAIKREELLKRCGAR